VLLTSPSGPQIGSFWHKTPELLAMTRIRARGDGYKELSLRFANGSGIVGLPGVEGTMRGFSKVSLMLIADAPRLGDRMCSATECPRIRKEFLAEELAEHGEDGFRREYLCKFLDSRESVFDRDLLDRAMDDDAKELPL